MRFTGHVARIDETRNACNNSVGKSERNKPLGKPQSRLEDNIKMDLKEIGWKVLDWVHVAQARDQWRALVNTVINLRVS
jgi:hypothetical protein